MLSFTSRHNLPFVMQGHPLYSELCRLITINHSIKKQKKVETVRSLCYWLHESFFFFFYIPVIINSLLLPHHSEHKASIYRLTTPSLLTILTACNTHTHSHNVHTQTHRSEEDYDHGDLPVHPSYWPRHAMLTVAGSRRSVICNDTSNERPVPAIHITRLTRTRIEAKMWVTTSSSGEVSVLFKSLMD